MVIKIRQAKPTTTKHRIKANSKRDNIVNTKKDDTHRISGNIVKIKSTMTAICDASSAFLLTPTNTRKTHKFNIHFTEHFRFISRIVSVA